MNLWSWIRIVRVSRGAIGPSPCMEDEEPTVIEGGWELEMLQTGIVDVIDCTYKCCWELGCLPGLVFWGAAIGMVPTFAENEPPCSVVLELQVSAGPINGEWLAQVVGFGYEVLEEGMDI